MHIALPLGISFFTFQQIAFLVDIWHGKSERSGVRDFGLFVTFFPQRIAGPIVHHAELVPQFRREGGNEIVRNLAVGLAIFIVGLGKKTLMADSLSPFAGGAFAAADAGAGVSFAVAWTGTLAYSLQIYFDFSGYSDMALGLARILPNTAQLFARELPDWPLHQADVQPIGWPALQFAPRTLPAMGLGLILFSVISNLWATSEFIYFQF